MDGSIPERSGGSCYAWDVFGPLLRVARPDDWTGTLASVAVVAVLALLVVVALLVRLPPHWVALAGGMAWVVRAALMLAALVVVGFARTVLDARLPRAAVLWGRKVRFHDGTRRRAVAIDQILAVYIERRPPPMHEVFAIQQHDGSEHDVCATHWGGAPALHRTLQRRVRSAQARKRRQQARQRPVRSVPKTSGST